MRNQNWSAEIFALSLPLFAITGAGMSLLWGRLIDIRSARILLPLVFIPMVVGCFMVEAFNGNWVIFVVMALFGGSAGMAQTSSGALWPELFGLKHLGEIRSTIAPVSVLSTAIAPFVTGLALDYGISMETQLIYMAMSAMGFSLLIFLARGRIENIMHKFPT